MTLWKKNLQGERPKRSQGAVMPHLIWAQPTAHHCWRIGGSSRGVSKYSYRNRNVGFGIYSLQVDSSKWIESRESLVPMEVAAARGRQHAYSLQISLRTIHKAVLDGGWIPDLLKGRRGARGQRRHAWSEPSQLDMTAGELVGLVAQYSTLQKSLIFPRRV